MGKEDKPETPAASNTTSKANTETANIEVKAAVTVQSKQKKKEPLKTTGTIKVF